MSNKQIPEEVLQQLRRLSAERAEAILYSNMCEASKDNPDIISNPSFEDWKKSGFGKNDLAWTVKAMEEYAALHPPQQGSADIVYVPVSDTPNVHKDAFWCEEVGEWLKPQPSGKAGAWISVEDKLPDERPGWSHSLDVNILREDGVVSTGAYGWMNNLGWADYLYGNNKSRITHWQPLPKPPQQSQVK